MEFKDNVLDLIHYCDKMFDESINNENHSLATEYNIVKCELQQVLEFIENSNIEPKTDFEKEVDEYNKILYKGAK